MELQASSHRSFPWTPDRIPRGGDGAPIFLSNSQGDQDAEHLSYKYALML